MKNGRNAGKYNALLLKDQNNNKKKILFLVLQHV
jgi:hypothetical protein